MLHTSFVSEGEAVSQVSNDARGLRTLLEPALPDAAFQSIRVGDNSGCLSGEGPVSFERRTGPEEDHLGGRSSGIREDHF